MIPVNTTVGTPGNMNLCAGKAIFPINGSDVTMRLGYQTEFNLISNNNVVCGGEFFAGICGPSWAMRTEIEGEITGDTITLNPVNCECTAGTLCGASVSLTLDCHGSVMFIEFAFTLTAELDILELLMKAYEYATGKKLLPEVPGAGAERKSYGVNDGGTTTLGSSLALKRAPACVIQWDLWPLVLAAQPGATEEWKAVKWVFNIAFGPEIKIALNVDLKMTKVTVNAAEYTNLVYNETTGGISGTSLSPEPAVADPVSVTFHEVPSITFGVGVFLEFTFVQVFSIRIELVFDILQDLGYSLFGEYDQNVDNTAVGGACIPCGEEQASGEIYEVEFV